MIIVSQKFYLYHKYLKRMKRIFLTIAILAVSASAFAQIETSGLDAGKNIQFMQDRLYKMPEFSKGTVIFDQDAALYEPYANDPSNTGVLYYTDEQVIEFCKAANRAGLQIEMHAIGDRAFDQACRGIKAALDDYPREDHRHGIIHACLTTEWGRHVCMDYKIQLPMQVAFDNWPQEPAEYIEEIQGKERASGLNPARTFTDLGCVVSFSSDGPCTAPDPIVWLDKAVNYSNPELRMTIREALRMSTYNGYWTTFDEKERGSLEPGKVADMAVLSANPYEIDSKELKDLKVEQTILGGKPYAKQKGGFVPTVLKGILGSGSF